MKALRACSGAPGGRGFLGSSLPSPVFSLEMQDSEQLPRPQGWVVSGWLERIPQPPPTPHPLLANVLPRISGIDSHRPSCDRILTE